MTAHNVDIHPASVTSSALNVFAKNVTRCDFCHNAKWEGTKCKVCDHIKPRMMTRMEREAIARETAPPKIVKRRREPSEHAILTSLINRYGYYIFGEVHLNEKGIQAGLKKFK